MRMRTGPMPGKNEAMGKIRGQETMYVRLQHENSSNDQNKGTSPSVAWGDRCFVMGKQRH